MSCFIQLFHNVISIVYIYVRILYYIHKKDTIKTKLNSTFSSSIIESKALAPLPTTVNGIE